MAVLHLARVRGSLGFEKYVVLKRMSAQLASDPEFVRMFLAEARHAAKLDHPNIVHVSDLGRDDEGLFYVMEYVHGEDLRKLIAANVTAERALDLAAVVSIGVGAAAALHHAHTRKDFNGIPLGLVHRDVSPTNILVSYEGVVKLVDFGIAKAKTDAHATRPSVRKGKIGYLSPEQCKGASVDGRSDVFSLGIVLHELVTSQKLFDAESEFAVMNKIVNGDAPRASELRPGTPPALDDIIERTLRRDPDERFQSALELQRALDQFAASSGLSVSSAALADTVLDVFGTRPLPWERAAQDADLSPPKIPARDEQATRVAESPATPEPTRSSSRTPLVAGVLVAGVAATWALWPSPHVGSDPPTAGERAPTSAEPASKTPPAPASKAPGEPSEPAEPSPAVADDEPSPPQAVPPADVKPEPAKPEPAKAKPPRRPRTARPSAKKGNGPTEPKPAEPTSAEPKPKEPAPFDPDGLGPLRTVLK